MSVIFATCWFYSCRRFPPVASLNCIFAFGAPRSCYYEVLILPRAHTHSWYELQFLPIARTTTEEIAGYALENIRDMMGSEYLQQRETKWIEISVSEQAGTRVTCRRSFEF
eukprot:GHVU01038248.1.p1 GENE.GHVU01038248.1~~GHVU01038248.1.p1  ORF type:complete len:111 (-),score=3.09 GHVU01038248.1:33-365(-)